MEIKQSLFQTPMIGGTHTDVISPQIHALAHALEAVTPLNGMYYGKEVKMIIRSLAITCRALAESYLPEGETFAPVAASVPTADTVKE